MKVGFQSESYRPFVTRTSRSSQKSSQIDSGPANAVAAGRRRRVSFSQLGSHNKAWVLQLLGQANGFSMEPKGGGQSCSDVFQCGETVTLVASRQLGLG